MIKIGPGYVPDSYYSSRDYRVFLKLLGAVTSVFKSNIDSFPSLYSPDDCPDNLVRLLAGMVGYTYNDSLSIDDNRIIIKYYPYMIRYRGSEEGVKLAAALTLNTSDDADKSYTLDNVIVEYDYNTGLLRIYYPYADEIRRDLIEAVRPVGSFIQMVPSFISENTDELDVKATIIPEVSPYDKSREQVGKSKVGFGNVELEDS